MKFTLLLALLSHEVVLVTVSVKSDFPTERMSTLCP